jgi:hypothetical protein
MADQGTAGVAEGWMDGALPGAGQARHGVPELVAAGLAFRRAGRSAPLEGSGRAFLSAGGKGRTRAGLGGVLGQAGSEDERGKEDRGGSSTSV